MDIRYREAREQDLHEITDVLLMTLGDLYERFSSSTPIPPRDAVELAYGHLMDTGTFRVAEVDGRMVSIGAAVVRDDLWYLSSFWTLPEYQRQKIGGPLLDQVWEFGKKAGARTFFTWSSVDPAAMSAYMKRGMLPGYQILGFRGMPGKIPPKPSGYEAGSLEKSVAMRLDEVVRGTTREADHSFWLGRGGAHGRAVRRGGNVVGYYYVSKAGMGPVAWDDPRQARPMLTLALHDALENNGNEVTIAIPGVNHEALRFALESGLQLTGHAHLLTTSPFGRMEQYIPSGPSLF